MRSYRRWIEATENPFSQLLFVISLLFITTSFANSSRLSATSITLLFFAVLVLSFRVLGFSHKLFQWCAWLAGITYIVDALAIHVFQYALPLRGLTKIVYAGLLAIAIVVLSRRIFQEQRVTGDTLRGSACIYFLLGYFWFALYQAIQYFDANAFSVSVERSSNALLYFSFTTLTTMGYGDIVPVNAFAMFAANLEGVVGVL